jgi:peptidoglycan hydrolase-like protein with peptidoglycan-binding domain
MRLDADATGATQRERAATTPIADEPLADRRRRPWRVVGAFALAAAVGAGSWVVAARVGRAGATPATPPAPLATATVARGTITSTQSIDGTLGYGDSVPVLGKLSGTVTWLPDAGDTVARDHELYEVDGSNPVIMLTGSRPAWRPFASGMRDGPDIRELEANLKALGYDPDGDMTVDDHFTAATAAAIERWQDAHGLDRTGTIPLGQVVFLPWARARVSSLTASAGSQAIGPVMRVTSTIKQATAALDASLAYLVHKGETVEIELPGDKTTSARVSDVGTVASSSGNGNNGAGGGNGNNNTPTVNVTATLTDQHAVGNLDQAPITMDIATARRGNVLYVPVTALLALQEGGYAVEVVRPNGQHQLVGVTTGLYSADGNVEISGGGLRAGDRVVVSQ